MVDTRKTLHFIKVSSNNSFGSLTQASKDIGLGSMVTL